MIGYLSQNYPLIHAFGPRVVRRTRRETLALNRVFKMAPNLSDYFHSGEIVAAKGPLDRPISGLAIDSRRVVPGNLFFALPGRRADGTTFIDEAVSRGAVAVVAQKLPAVPPAKVIASSLAYPDPAASATMETSLTVDTEIVHGIVDVPRAVVITSSLW